MRNASEKTQPGHKPDDGSEPWIHLDGTYILRSTGNIVSTNSDDWRGLQRDIPAKLNRFEVRVEASSPSPPT